MVKFICKKVVFIILVCWAVFSTKADSTNMFLWNQYTPVLQQFDTGVLNVALKTVNTTISKNKHQLSKTVFNKVSFGFLLKLLKGKILIRYMPPKPIEAYRSFDDAMSWLLKTDPKQSCSNAWSELYYEMGKTCGEIGRRGDAEIYFYRSLQFSNRKNKFYYKAQIADIENDIERNWIIQAYNKLTNYWQNVSLPDKQSHIVSGKILFCKNKDKKAFDTLLDGLAKFGISSEYAENDSLIYNIVNNLGRATDEQVATLYILLDMELQSMPLKKRKEKLAVFIINQRNLLAESYPHLSKANDILELKKRVLRKYKRKN
ncbi:MAG: hypothetical protein DRJ01_17635 [Bacteroidetes bacterium]|nr:MAG: hypothetical protein DRJ01_17635 [Bacteroidota bacterium]